MAPGTRSLNLSFHLDTLMLIKMQALHLPGVLKSQTQAYNFPENPPNPDVLQYSTDYPRPGIPRSWSNHAYTILVSTTALTKGELTWPEILDSIRFHPHGGAIPGHDVVGTIHSVHAEPNCPNPPLYKPGNQIWGLLDFHRDGAAATYTSALEHEICPIPHQTPQTHPLPTNITWHHLLATLPLSGLTAYQALYKRLPLPPPPPASSVTPASPDARTRLLITAPTGTVGLIALQLARLSHLHITVLTTSRHIELLTSPPFHIDEIINLDPATSTAAATITSLPAAFAARSLPAVDYVLDCLGGTTLADICVADNVVKQGGKVVSVAGEIEGGLGTIPKERVQEVKEGLRGREVSFEFFIVEPDVEGLGVLGGMLERGEMRGWVGGVWELERGREAMEAVERGGRARGLGKAVLNVGGGMGLEGKV